MATLWSPDTCDCQIEYDMEGEEFRNVNAIKTCKLHADLAGDELLTRVLDRNRTKNYVRAELVAQGADERQTRVRYDPADGEDLIATDHGFDADKISSIAAPLADKFPGKRIKVV
jgi:hypothetical protein